jgi:hypothetical protein
MIDVFDAIEIVVELCVELLMDRPSPNRTHQDQMNGFAICAVCWTQPSPGTSDANRLSKDAIPDQRIKRAFFDHIHSAAHFGFQIEK